MDSKGFFVSYFFICMKVAHFIDNTVSVGGAEVLVIELCRNLKRYHIDTEVLHFGHPWLERKCNEYQISSVVLPGHRYYKSIKTIPFFTIGFQKYLKKSNIDILHSHLLDSITGACFGAFLSHTPHIGTLHDIHTLEEQPAKLWLLQIAASLGTKLITVSKNMEDFIQKHVIFFKGAYKTIYNGVDTDKFISPTNYSNGLRKSLTITDKDFVFICVGRLAEIKGHEVLIEAFSKLNFKENVKLIIVGDGPRRDFIRDQISFFNLDGNVKMLGLRQDIPDLLNISDCFVLSSHSEGLSYSIIEAMATGLPVVATDVGGNYELVKNNKTGYLVPPNNPSAMAEKLNIILGDEMRRKKMAETARTIVCKKFSMDSMIKKYKTVYEEVV